MIYSNYAAFRVFEFRRTLFFDSGRNQSKLFILMPCFCISAKALVNADFTCECVVFMSVSLVCLRYHKPATFFSDFKFFNTLFGMFCHKFKKCFHFMTASKDFYLVHVVFKKYIIC